MTTVKAITNNINRKELIKFDHKVMKYLISIPVQKNQPLFIQIYKNEL